jgi:hypothetical protein
VCHPKGFNFQFKDRWSQILLQNRLFPIRLHAMAVPAAKDPVFWLAIRGLPVCFPTTEIAKYRSVSCDSFVWRSRFGCSPPWLRLQAEIIFAQARGELSISR